METKIKVKFSQVKYQYITILGVSIISLCHGFAVGWLSSAVPILKSEDTPLQSGPLTVQQTMWLGGVYSLGGAIGSGVFGILVNYFGRTTSMSLLAIPNFTFWFTVLFANNFNQLVVGRFFAGISGGLCVCVPLFVAEIANKEIRGFLGLMGPLISAVGMLFSYICGAFVEYRSVPYCMMGFPVLFFVAMLFTPETPHKLIVKGNLQKAERSMIFYNNGNCIDSNGYDVKAELDKLKEVVEQQKEDRKKSSFKLIFRKDSFRGLLIGISLVAVSVFSGISVMTAYAAQLFIDSGANFDANLSAIIIGILQVCGIYASSMLVDRIGRRILLGISSLSAAIAIFVFGTFSYLAKQGFDLTSVDWIPVASASFYTFVICVGVKPMPYLYVAEILPGNTRHIGLSICMVSLTLFSTTAVFTLPILVDLFELHAVMWTYGCTCLLGTLFSVFVMSETKGKNLNKI
ncbi:facilitated trehalose transporter Tret1-like isoform X4 [Bradysia coprophila]|uniref:facilitated trehalose transporter Tret1-like isoform X4 n=1 Tax=Bradysia coprophila TaxID=38358 RepID=UPI00187DAEC9|nr:facilitated trehalose transporter Tret1-like isoform X4 [Bradysia coprophila]